MGRASHRFVHLRCGLRTGAPARGSDARRRSRPAILLSWFEGRVRIPPWAFVFAQGFVGCLVARSITPDILTTIFRKWPMFLTLIGAVIIFRRRPRLCARPLESVSGHDGGLGLFARRGDRDGADGRSFRRRHEARRRHAISARRMRRTGGVDRRPGMVGLGRRGAGFDRLVPAGRGRAASWRRWPWPSAAPSSA